MFSVRDLGDAVQRLAVVVPLAIGLISRRDEALHAAETQAGLAE
jgi:hypothetical protein